MGVELRLSHENVDESRPGAKTFPATNSNECHCKIEVNQLSKKVASQEVHCISGS